MPKHLANESADTLSREVTDGLGLRHPFRALCLPILPQCGVAAEETSLELIAGEEFSVVHGSVIEVHAPST